jgi:transcription antitermination factor NusG
MKTARKPAKKPAKKPAAKKPAKRRPKTVPLPPPPPPRREKARCENCIKLTFEDQLREMYGEHRCPECRTFWYAVAVSPDVHEDITARKLRRAAKNLPEFKEVLVPRRASTEFTKTTFRVWEDEKAKKNGWRIPEGERDPEVLRSFGLLGIVAADSFDEARDAARRKYPNDFDRVVEPHGPGGKPRVLRRIKFPGYVLVRCEYTDDVHHALHSTSGVFGALPLCPNPHNGFVYPRKEPKRRRKPQLWELEVQEEWSPTPLDTQAEVEALLQEKEDLKKLNKPAEVQFPTGQEVRVVNGQWENAVGVVDSYVNGGTPKYKVAFNVLGRKVLSEFEGWMLVKENSY